jgi:hypothetical protein
MSIGREYVFRRGQEPIKTERYSLQESLHKKIISRM